MQGRPGVWGVPPLWEGRAVSSWQPASRLGQVLPGHHHLQQELPRCFSATRQRGPDLILSNGEGPGAIDMPLQLASCGSRRAGVLMMHPACCSGPTITAHCRHRRQPWSACRQALAAHSGIQPCALIGCRGLRHVCRQTASSCPRAPHLPPGGGLARVSCCHLCSSGVCLSVDGCLQNAGQMVVCM